MEKKRTRDIRFWVLVWGLGLVGQLCWNIENQWFNTFVYAKIAKDLGMDPDEVLRLSQVGGLADLFKDRNFSEAWK